MPILGKSPYDDASAIISDLIPTIPVNLGTADHPFKSIVVEDQIVQETITAEAFNLEDGSPLNYSVAAHSAGTVYTLTAVAAAVDFGTTDPAIVLNKAGKYILRARAVIKFNAATFAANQTLTLKLRRTTNTAADVANTTTIITLPIITTITDGFEVTLPEVIYDTTGPTVITDAIAVWGLLSATPSAGSVTVQQANIIATRIG